MDKQITSLLNFIDNSPCNFYAVNTAKKMLEENGFTEKLLGNEIEAKEKVKIADESKTLATITFQNYFRMYDKLSGMTGTAMTEETQPSLPSL